MTIQGRLKPSKSEVEVTKKMKEAYKLLNIQLFDHLLISEAEYFNFTNAGL